MLKTLVLLASILYTLILSALSLIKINTVIKDIPSFNDKLAHATAHFILVVLWFIAFHFKCNFKYNKALIFTPF